MIGEYGWDHDVLYILEKNGKLHALIEWFFDYPLEETGPDQFRLPDYGLYSDESVVFHRDERGKVKDALAASVVLRRRLDGVDGQVFRIKPVRPLEVLRSQADAAQPPAEKGQFLEPDLAELTTLDPSIKLDIRYAGTNNFLGAPVYKKAMAVMQRPAARGAFACPSIACQGGLRPVDSRRLSALAGDQDLLGRRSRVGPDLRG